MLMAMMHGCFILEVLPSETQVKKTTGGRPPEAPPQQPLLPVPDKLTPQRLVRRLAIDLTGQLPLPADIEAVAADPTHYTRIAERLLNSSAAAESIAMLHRRIWELRADQLPDLDRFVTDGATALASKLTAGVREQITHAPLQHVRWVYEMQLPFSSVFTSGFTFATNELLDLWDSTSDGAAWPGDIWYLHSYSDSRPDGGIITSPSLNALIDARQQPEKRSRSFELLRRFTCATMENKDAHLYYALTGDELLAGTETLATTRKDCAGCHRQIESAGGALQNFASGSTFAQWRGWTDPAEDFAGFYNGYPVTGTAAWITALGADRRLASCEARKLSEALYQRRYGIFDSATTSIGLAAYEENGGNLRDIVRAIVQSVEYQTDLVNPNVKGEYERNSSGVRILRRHQWKSIVAGLVPSAGALTFSESLDPGADEAIDGVDMVPTGSYWHEVDKLARKAAAMIVAEELADTAVTLNRRVLTVLPDGSAFGVSSAGVYAQIKALWQNLTGEALDETSTVYTDFQTLWAGSGPDTSAEDFRRAWRVVLTAMFTHPRFMTY